MLKQRIKRLENERTDRGNTLIVISSYVRPNGSTEPAIGYHVEGKELFRLDDESDEELEVRACVALRAQAPNDAIVLVLKPIEQEETCCA